MRKGNILVWALVALSLLLVAPMVQAQEVSPSASGATLGRQPPTDVAALVSKVIRGVVVVEELALSNPIPASFSALGSGFVIDKEGHVITNAHVAGKSGILRVILWDGTSYRATLVAAAPGLDIALIKIEDPDPDMMFPVTLGDSDKVRPGELALAMGSPGAEEGFNIDRSNPFEYFGLRSTATMRVVTGRNTNIDYQVVMWQYGKTGMGLQYATKLPYTFLMCTPINHGNSGGPLFNSKGEVIGINTWGWGNSPLAQQLNGSVPVNCAKQFAAEVLEKKHWDVPWLGMYVLFPGNIQTAEAYIEFKERFRTPGLHVYGVVPDSPAAQAGLREGDEILDVNGHEYENPEDFRADVLGGAIGQEYSLLLRRGNKTFTARLQSVPKPRWVYDFSV